jgi:hypothetical protein
MVDAAAEYDELLARAAPFLRRRPGVEAAADYGHVAVSDDAWLRAAATPFLRGLPGLPRLRRYDPRQMRDPGGEDGGQWVSDPASALKDVLKLAEKIDLAPDEKLVGSAKIDSDNGGIRLALIDRNGTRVLRLGAGGEAYGQRDRESGVAAWDGNPSRPPLSTAERARLSDEKDALDEEYDSASAQRQAEIDARTDEIFERLTTDDIGFNATTELDESGMRRLADQIRPLLAAAVDRNKAENKAWDEIEALEAAGNPDPARMAALRRIVDRGDGGTTEAIEFGSGTIPGTWGDVVFSVDLDDPSMGPSVHLGVKPKGAPDNWGNSFDWQGSFDPAETRKFLRLLDKYANAT